ncbi:MAG: hypothetical protein AAF098_06785 [Pseudomonadota bacterium]
MTPDELLAYCGRNGGARAARVLGISKQCIGIWKKRGFIPLPKQYEIQVKSDNELVADNFDPGRDYVAELKGRVQQAAGLTACR